MVLANPAPPRPWAQRWPWATARTSWTWPTRGTGGRLEEYLARGAEDQILAPSAVEARLRRADGSMFLAEIRTGAVSY